MLRADSSHLSYLFHLILVSDIVPFTKQGVLLRLHDYTRLHLQRQTPGWRGIRSVCVDVLPYPHMLAVPDDGEVIPVSILNNVDLPAPLCPKIAVISLG